MNRPMTPADSTKRTCARPMAITAIEDGLARVTSTAVNPVQS
jgi:hypothetical protein